ncbi:hypothetical protein [Thermophagus xiamenensis]|nr:hypothetical protein [Thermophagus xiamenensis]
MERTIEQLREQYEIEKELAGRLKNAGKNECICIHRFTMSYTNECLIIRS